MFLKAFFLLNGGWLGSSLLHPSRRLTVCIRRSTRPIERWSLAGAYINLILSFAHRSFTLLPFRQRAWSSLMFSGTPCWAMYLFRIISMFGPFAFVTSFKVGNFEKRSMHARKYTSLPCPSIFGPPKSNWISSFGSEHCGRGAQRLFGFLFFKFLPNSVRGRHVLDLFIKSRLMKGHYMRCPNSVMPQAPGCVECKTSRTDSLRLLGMASLLSSSTQPFCTLRLLHLAWICLLSFLHRCSSPVRMQYFPEYGIAVGHGGYKFGAKAELRLAKSQLVY